ncbi:hypothetical protein DSO57_1036306 [Entomophthora muscae]|uniref:Uncharacterized protein n=1 Tax=Entomophthora muscae TaxID=34485 RepID=A0ACC2SNP7_9FUNG|nr:hypothetical protein DSO57_1036306 [Entomophthora muscae]
MIRPETRVQQRLQDSRTWAHPSIALKPSFPFIYNIHYNTQPEKPQIHTTRAKVEYKHQVDRLAGISSVQVTLPFRSWRSCSPVFDQPIYISQPTRLTPSHAQLGYRYHNPSQKVPSPASQVKGTKA